MSGLAFTNHQVVTLVGAKSGTTRTSRALTASYQTESGTQPTKSFDVGGFSRLNLDVLYTTGAAETTNSVEVKLEATTDGTNWYQLTNESASSGTSTLYAREFTFVGALAATAYAFTLGLDIFYKKMRVSCKETGVASNFGTVYVEATLSGY